MAAIRFIVKFFPEITIKSKPVRRQFVGQLAGNVKRVLREVDPDILVQRDWDKLVVSSALEGATAGAQLVDALSRVSGIAYFLDVLEFPLGDFDDVLAHTRAVYEERLAGKTFAVRCKRVGQHEFRSIDVEHYVGGGLNRQTAATRVNLSKPDVTVQLEIRDNRLYVVNQRHKGLGGFPIGSLDPVLSLISGGFDSTVASYLTMKRGMQTHFCFFNLGGRDHEVGVKEIALYLWLRYGSTHSVKFISVPFEEVVAAILTSIEDPQMGVILKRMMLRAASSLAEKFDIDALVTGEAVAQVSSQTLRNLAVIDSATDTLVLRPLIATDKEAIIRLSAEIGAEEFAASMPEYCGVISVNPTTRARPERVAEEERHFDFSILERAVDKARVQSIWQLAEEEFERSDIEVLSVPLVESVIIDVRHPAEEELKPLQVPGEVMKIPFYELHTRMQGLDNDRTYMLYCDRGVISKLQAGHLLESGYPNIKVYRP